MKILCPLCILALLLCTAVPVLAQNHIIHLSDLTHKKIAVPKGTAADQLVAKALPKAKILYYDNVLDCAVAVKAGLADAAAYDEPVLRTLLRTNNDLVILPEFLTHDNYGMAVNKNRQDIKAVMDACIDRFAAAGAFKFMDILWFHGAEIEGPPRPIAENYVGVLRFGTCAQLEPFAFKIESGEVLGFDIELAYCVAQTMGLQLEVYDMPFEDLVPALLNDEVDMIGAGITITPARAEQVLFSKPYYQSGIAAIVKK